MRRFEQCLEDKWAGELSRDAIPSQLDWKGGRVLCEPISRTCLSKRGKRRLVELLVQTETLAES